MTSLSAFIPSLGESEPGHLGVRDSDLLLGLLGRDGLELERRVIPEAGQECEEECGRIVRYPYTRVRHEHVIRRPVQVANDLSGLGDQGALLTDGQDGTVNIPPAARLHRQGAWILV
jgi:hypothetical protein